LKELLPAYLALASSMGADLDTRAWELIAAAPEMVEFDERGTPGHDALAAFVKDHNAVAPDDQGVILSVVAHYCDAAMFEQLHAVAKAAKAESELRRHYSALMSVQDSGLAQQAAPFKLAEKQTLLPAAARST
jgi:hypothetical protein